MGCNRYTSKSSERERVYGGGGGSGSDPARALEACRGPGGRAVTEADSVPIHKGLKIMIAGVIRNKSNPPAA